MQHGYVFRYGRVTFKPLKETEIERMRLLRNKWKDCFIFSEEISKQKQIEWYQKYLRLENDIMFSLYSQNGVWMGVAGLSNIDMRKRSAEFGRLMIEKDEVTEKGLGVDIVNGIVNLAIGKMAINKITLEVFSDNIAALKTYERTGFVKTGRTEALHDGRKLIYMERTIEEERK